MSNSVAHQPLLKHWGGFYTMLLLITWIGRGDGKCLFNLDLLMAVIPVCLEKAAVVSTAVLGD